VSIAQETPVRARSSAWWWLVAACALVLVAAAAAVAIWWVASSETRTGTYRVLGDLAGLKLDLGSADVEIDGGGGAVEVRRVDRFAFGHPAGERRTVSGGVVTLASRCPDQVLGACRVSYRVTLPDNVPVDVRTSSGNVRMSGVRASVTVSTGSGAITASKFCGHSLRAVSDSGGVSASAECSTEQLELRSRSGDVRAAVPAGRYRIDAQSDSGVERIRGITNADDAPFQVQALSTTGDVTVDGTS
jgi:hypothetical protein